MIRRSLVFGLLCVAGLLVTAGQAAAQNLNNRDRLLLFMNVFQNQRNQSQILANQQRIASDFSRYNAIPRTSGDPIDRYVRQGREESPQGVPLPAMYAAGSQGGNRGYFMRNSSFGAASLSPTPRLGR